MHADKIRAALFHEIAQKAGSHSLQPGSVLNKVARDLNIPTDGPDARALLTAWSDLFRGGYVSWGYNLSNIDPPFYHVTEKGSRILQTLSRDPSNPSGYRAYLASKTKLNSTAESYVREALDTYNSGSYKAAAVMIGAASESLVLELRDALSTRLAAVGQAEPPTLAAWQVRAVLGAIEDALDQKKKSMPPKLREEFEAYWPAFTQQIRAVRNDAGHPTSVDPISEEAVHASLLIFPELAALSGALCLWVREAYT
jgi:hypothetical protein